MIGLRSLLSATLALTSVSYATAQSQTASAPAPGSTVSLLFLNTTAMPLTAYVERYEPAGQTTYLVNCGKSATSCEIHDATLSIVEGRTYDFHTAVNSGGALTIHCVFEADGRTPTQCTKTVAGGPTGYEIETSNPTADQWAYLPVMITKKPQSSGFDGFDASSASLTGASPTASSSTNVIDKGASATVQASSASATSGVEDGTNAAETIKGGFSVVAGAAVALIAVQLFFLSA